MTDKNLTEIVAILDRSGSMWGLVADTIGGFNSFIAEQRKALGIARLTLAQFDDKYQIDYESVDLKDVPDLNDNTYVPRGGTALFDAVGKTIVTVGERLAKLDESQRPGQVIFLIVTDGQENASTEYTTARVQELVKQQTEVYNWTFVFMGGGDLSTQTAQSTAMGIPQTNSYNYGNNTIGTRALYATVTKGVSKRREELTKGIIVGSSASILDDDDRAELLRSK
jgi:uncharacterized protein YegL